MTDQTIGKIDFLDLQKQYQSIKEEAFQALLKVGEKTAFTGGPFVADFEKNFSKYCEVNNTSALNSGTAALHFAMIALKIGQGDEVIVPANTFIATAWGPSHSGATPVFTDCKADTWTIDPEKIEAKLTSKTKAIIGVHLYGQPFDVDAVKAIAKKHNLYLVEDCAQAHGAKYRGRVVGGLADMGCFSFYPGKNLGAFGEGGAVTSSNAEYIETINCLRNQGSKEKYYHDMIGYNERMHGFQGAVLNVKLKYIDRWNQRRKEIAKMYHDKIVNTKIKMQKQPEWSDSVYHLFVITADDRDSMMKYLQANNIFPGIHYPVPCHLQKAYAGLGYKHGDFPEAEFQSAHCLSLPMYPELTDDEIGKVIDIINKY